MKKLLPLSLLLLTTCTTPAPFPHFRYGGLSDSGNPHLTSDASFHPLLSSLDPAQFAFEPDFWSFDPATRTLHGKSPGGPLHHYLYTTADYTDFELHADFKMLGYNSGICTRIEPTTFDNAPGYQIDMGDAYWGCLWEEKGRGYVVKFPADQGKALLKPIDPANPAAAEWNHYHIIASGHHISAWLNGTQTIDIDDTPGRLKGKLGFQLAHSKPTEVWFKNVVIRLPS